MALDAMNDISDDALLVLYANGDPQAAQALTLRLSPAILSHAYRVLGDRAEAEDVTQDAMMRLWKIAPEWRQGEAKVTTWLYRVTANLCTDRLRKRRTVDIDSVAEPESGAPSVIDGMQEAARAKALQEALNRLPERQRQAVVLRHIEGLSNPEIAQVMDIGVEAVESLTARAKRALTGALAHRRADLGFEDG